MNRNVDEQYRAVLKDILDAGTRKEDRTGTGTLSAFGRIMRFDMALGFPMVTIKKTNFRPIVHELLWMLNAVDASYGERGFGPNNIKYLCDNNVTIWNEWPHKNYVETNTNLDYLVREVDEQGVESYRDYDLKEFAQKVREDDTFARLYGRLGNVYGQQWNFWEGDQEEVHNQIDNAVRDIQNNPDSRRILVSAWNPGQLKNQLLPPCHYAFQFWTRPMTLSERMAAAGIVELSLDNADSTEETVETDAHVKLDAMNVPKRKLSLMFQMRSVDMALGMPFDIASYALQLSIIAQVTGTVPDELVVVSGDTHIYANHIEGVNEFIDRPAFPLPRLKLNPARKNVRDFRFDDIELVGYESGPAVKMPIAV